MIVEPASSADIPGWNELARTVEALFGAPMAEDEGFQAVLKRKIEQGLAFCVREQNGPPGTPLCGGLLFSTSHAPVYEIGWLAVAETQRRQGTAQALIAYAMRLVVPLAEVIVTTFTAGSPGGDPARRLYESLGFLPAELLPGPDGTPRQRYRKLIEG